MGYPITLRLDCQFCLEKREVNVISSDDFKAVSVNWLRAHSCCAKDKQGVQVVASSSTSKDGPRELLGSFVLR